MRGKSAHAAGACYGNSSGFRPAYVPSRITGSSLSLSLSPLSDIRLIFRANSRAEFHLESLAALETPASRPPSHRRRRRRRRRQCARRDSVDGNIGRITVGRGTLGISCETPCLEHVSDEIIARLGFQREASQALFLSPPSPSVSFSLRSSSPFLRLFETRGN